MVGKSEERTLLSSVLLSAPGPILLGVGLMRGSASTQLADFIRRSVELAALIVSYMTYRTVRRSEGADHSKRGRLERISEIAVGAAMCLSGMSMAVIAVLIPFSSSGNVVIALTIAFLGAVTNLWFWVRYARLDRREPNLIINAQARLYRAKTFVDICVTSALSAVMISPESPVVRRIDTGGSILVSAYMLLSGLRMIHAAGMHKKSAGVNAPRGHHGAFNKSNKK